MTDCGSPVCDRVELWVVVVVLCDKLKPDFGLLVAEVDGDCVCEVEVRVGMGDNDGAFCEHDVTNFDGPCFPFPVTDEDIFAAAEGEEECARQELRAGSGSGEASAADSESKDRWGQGLLMFHGWVFEPVGGNLAADVFVGLASAVGDGVLLVI